MPENAGNNPPAAKIISVNETKRIEILDVLRGIGFLGGLFVTIWFFGGLSRNMQNNYFLHPSGGNYRLFATIQLLFQGKMLAIICIVFGASMVSFFSGQNTKSKLSQADVFTRRQLLLITLGAINGIFFLASNDLLFHLGIMGILLFAFVRLSPKALLIAALFTGIILTGKNYWRYADDKKAYNEYAAAINMEKKFQQDSMAKAKILRQKQMLDTGNNRIIKDTLTKAQLDDKEKWEGIAKAGKFDIDADKKEQQEKRAGTYRELWKNFLNQTEYREAAWTYTTGVWQLSSLMFLGMWLFKKRFFSNGLKDRHYLLLAMLLITIGLLAAWFRVYFQNASLLNYEKYVKRHALPFNILYFFEMAASALGYASLITWLINKKVFSVIFKAFAAAGKMALTNYIVQSLFFLLFFTGFGMTYYGKLSQYQLYILAAEVVLVQLVFSIGWLKYFYFGPLEWFIRSVSYGEILPFRRNQSKSSISVTPVSHS
jgi:uncharacterized protein